MLFRLSYNKKKPRCGMLLVTQYRRPFSHFRLLFNSSKITAKAEKPGPINTTPPPPQVTLVVTQADIWINSRPNANLGQYFYSHNHACYIFCFVFVFNLFCFVLCFHFTIPFLARFLHHLTSHYHWFFIVRETDQV